MIFNPQPLIFYLTRLRRHRCHPELIQRARILAQNNERKKTSHLRPRMKITGGQEPRDEMRNVATFFTANCSTIGANRTGFARIADCRGTVEYQLHDACVSTQVICMQLIRSPEKGNIQFTSEFGQIIYVSFVIWLLRNVTITYNIFLTWCITSNSKYMILSWRKVEDFSFS